uniref:Kazal-like domain-containing protein n=1 Tax=Musca domestica TaxID=7370 RepID=A0A1I8M3T5_MUSDO
MRFLAILIAIVMALVLVSAEEDPCLKPCARNFDFVCGQFPDGTTKTYNNPCGMEIEACQKGIEIVMLHRGTCDKPIKD